jgi:hypothetical protein
MKTVDTDGVLTQQKARKVLESNQINYWGKEARLRVHNTSGNRVYYGSLSSPEEVTEDGYDEVHLSDIEDADEDSVDAFIGAPENTLGEHRRAQSFGVQTDVAVSYGDGELVERLTGVRELASERDVRCVTLHPTEDEPVTTAYTDLKAVSVTRLFLPTEDVSLVRVPHNEVGEKLAQTALEYGTNDLGFMRDKDEKELALIGREAGLEPIERKGKFGGNE